MKSIRNLLYAAVAIITAISADARTAAEFFIDAPTEASMLFDRTLRMDMLDYYNAGLQRKVSIFNNPDGAVITALSDSSLTISIGDNSTIQFAVIPPKWKENPDTIIAIIETTATPVPDSSIFFYIPGVGYQGVQTLRGVPVLKDFLGQTDKKTSANAEMPPFLLATAEYIPSDRHFIFTNTTGQYYLDKERPTAVDAMTDRLAYKFSKSGTLLPDKNYFITHAENKR